MFVGHIVLGSQWARSRRPGFWSQWFRSAVGATPLELYLNLHVWILDFDSCKSRIKTKFSMTCEQGVYFQCWSRTSTSTPTSTPTSNYVSTLFHGPERLTKRVVALPTLFLLATTMFEGYSLRRVSFLCRTLCSYQKTLCLHRFAKDYGFSRRLCLLGSSELMAKIGTPSLFNPW